MEMFLLVPGLLLVGAAIGWVARGHVHDIADKAASAATDAAAKAAAAVQDAANKAASV